MTLNALKELIEHYATLGDILCEESRRALIVFENLYGKGDQTYEQGYAAGVRYAGSTIAGKIQESIAGDLWD